MAKMQWVLSCGHPTLFGTPCPMLSHSFFEVVEFPLKNDLHSAGLNKWCYLLLFQLLIWCNCISGTSVERGVANHPLHSLYQMSCTPGMNHCTFVNKNKCVSKTHTHHIGVGGSSSFLACNSRLRSAIRRHHPPQRVVLSQICCFRERKMVMFQILLNGAEPYDVGTTQLSSPVCRSGGQQDPLSICVVVHAHNMPK